MTTLNISALQAKIVSVMVRNRSMKAVSKMLTKGFKIVKTEQENSFSVVMKDETQSAVIINDRFVVISYAKPKGAKEQTIFLNKSLPVTSIANEKAIVIDLVEKTINNGDVISGFSIKDQSVPVQSLMANVRMTTVRNYIAHTQLYVVESFAGMAVFDNIKEVRQFINSEITAINEVFSPVNMNAFKIDIEAVAR